MTATRTPEEGAGPAVETRRSADRARAMTCFGLALPLGVVVLQTTDVALDTGRSVSAVFVAVGAAVAAGTLAAGLLGRGARSGTFRPIAALGLISSLGWLALWSIGEPRWVDPLLLASIAVSVPALALAAGDDAVQRPRRSAVALGTHPAGWAAAGVALAAVLVIIAPDRVWSDLTALGALVGAAGCAWRLTLPDRIDPRPSGSDGDAGAPSDPRRPLGAVLGASAGVLMGGVVMIAPFLEDEWQVGVRYHAAALATAGTAGAAVAVARRWQDEDLQRKASSRRPGLATVGVIGATAAVTMLIAAASETVVGIVVGSGVAAALALGAVLVDASPRRSAESALSMFGGWAAVVAGWNALEDLLGSPRVTLAAVSMPLGAMALIALRAPAPARRATAGAEATGEGGEPQEGPTGASLAVGAPEPPLLEVEGLEFSYGPVQVLFGVDLSVRSGEITALVGANGAGKTTLLDNIAGIATPSRGTIRFGGVDIGSLTADERVRCGLNHIGAGTAVAEDLSVAENLAAYGHTLTRSQARAGAQRAYEVFPALDERRGQRASLLSGGERQMLALAKSLVLSPRLLVIDEFSLGLAPIVVSGLLPVIRRLHAEGASILLVEQSVHVALDLADRATCMERGRIVFSGSAVELRDDPGLLEAVYLEGVSVALEHRAEAGSGREAP